LYAVAALLEPVFFGLKRESRIQSDTKVVVAQTDMHTAAAKFKSQNRKLLLSSECKTELVQASQARIRKIHLKEIKIVDEFGVDKKKVPIGGLTQEPVTDRTAAIDADFEHGKSIIVQVLLGSAVVGEY
jgi:hypothetical protein